MLFICFHASKIFDHLLVQRLATKTCGSGDPMFGHLSQHQRPRRPSRSGNPNTTRHLPHQKESMQRKRCQRIPVSTRCSKFCTDASHCQLGAVTWHTGKPIAFNGRKLNPASTKAVNNCRKGTAQHNRNAQGTLEHACWKKNRSLC